MQNRFHLLAFAGISAGCFLTSTSLAVPYGANLLANGNAEAGPFSETGGTVADVPGWTTTGLFTVVNYKSLNDNSGFPKVGDPGPGDPGKQFFAGGKLRHRIHGEDHGAPIDAGFYRFRRREQLGGTDLARMRFLL